MQTAANESTDETLSRRRFLGGASLLFAVAAGAPLLAACGASNDEPNATARQVQGTAATLYRQEGCSCCATYADYLRDNGFDVDMKTVDDLQPVRARYGIPEDAVGCHTSEIDGYVVEGHVPTEAIQRLLAERPELDGISVIGMPTNSPGMGEPNGKPLDVLAFRSGRVTNYMSLTTY